MNRTALGVVALAIGAILILGLYDVYKPQTNAMVHDTFNKIRLIDMSSDKAPAHQQPHHSENKFNIPQKDWDNGVKVEVMSDETRNIFIYQSVVHQFDPNNIDWNTDYGYMGVYKQDPYKARDIKKIDWSHPEFYHGYHDLLIFHMKK